MDTTIEYTKDNDYVDRYYKACEENDGMHSSNLTPSQIRYVLEKPSSAELEILLWVSLTIEDNESRAQESIEIDAYALLRLIGGHDDNEQLNIYLDDTISLWVG